MRLAQALQQNTAAVKANTLAQQQNTTAINVLRADVREAVDMLATVSGKLDQIIELLSVPVVPNPGPITVLITGESDMGLIFKVSLPAEPEGALDIASGELTVTVGAGEPSVIATAKGQLSVDDLQGADGETVSASFVFVDDAGNRSVVPSTASAVLADTIPPADPGALAIEITGEN